MLPDLTKKTGQGEERGYKDYKQPHRTSRDWNPTHALKEKAKNWELRKLKNGYVGKKT